MSAANLSWGMLGFVLGLVLSIGGIVALAVTYPEPTAIGSLTTIASTCAVGLGTVMNPNKKFTETEKDLRNTVEELKKAVQ